MYFATQPKIEYDLKPQSFPFSSSDFTIANNFFRRVSMNEDAFGYIAYFRKYAIPNDMRIETLAEGIYGSPWYDWIIAISNNITNTYTDWPLSENALRVWAEEEPRTVRFTERNALPERNSQRAPASKNIENVGDTPPAQDVR